MRRYYLENNIERYDLQSEASIAINPDGLGVELAHDFITVGNDFFLTSTERVQDTISFKLVFPRQQVSLSNYKKFVDFLMRSNTLKFIYMVNGIEYKRDVVLTGATKKEIDGIYGLVESDVKLQAKSVWYRDRETKDTAITNFEPQTFGKTYIDGWGDLPHDEMLVDPSLVGEAARLEIPFTTDTTYWTKHLTHEASPFDEGHDVIKIVMDTQGELNGNDKGMAIPINLHSRYMPLRLNTPYRLKFKAKMQALSVMSGQEVAKIGLRIDSQGSIVPDIEWNHLTMDGNTRQRVNAFGKESSSVERLYYGHMDLEGNEMPPVFINYPLALFSHHYVGDPEDGLDGKWHEFSIGFTLKDGYFPYRELMIYALTNTEALNVQITAPTLYTDTPDTGDIAIGYTYAPYTYDDDIPNGILEPNSMHITNNSMRFIEESDSGFVIEIQGPCDNPSWKLFNNGNLHMEDGYIGRVMNGNTLVVSSVYIDRFAVIINNTTGTRTNVESNLDMSKDNYVRIPNGDNILIVDGTTIDKVKVRWREEIGAV